jgi:Ycf66 protein N-terminus
MLAYILALAVAIGSLGIYLAAFFFPEIGRKNDIYWSGVGLFYALVLWVCAKQITGGLLLGQVAGVVLLGWFALQTLQLRRQLTPQQQQTVVPSAAQVTSNVREQAAKISPLQRLSQLGKKASSSATAAKEQLQTKSNVKEAPTPPEPTPNVEIIDNRTSPTPETAESVSTPEVKIAPEVEVIAPVESVESTDLVGAETQANSEPMADATIETTQPEVATTAEIESSSEQVPELHRPDPPSPELVEAAIEDAEEKHQPASPPESEEKS